MISVGAKAVTRRVATTIAHVTFSNDQPLPLIRTNAMRKGDVLAVARIAGVAAVKRTADLIPLCHSGLAVEGVRIHVEAVGPEGQSTTDKIPNRENTSFEASLERELARGLGKHGGVRVAITVECQGRTGVEMEALTGAMGAALTVVDMCKGVDKGLVIRDVRVVRKEGGRSGRWIVDGWE